MCRRFVVVLARSAAFVSFSGIYVRFFGICFYAKRKKFAKINFYKSNACTCLLFCVILCKFYILHTNKVVISKINCPP